MKVNDVLMDPQGEIYVVYHVNLGMPRDLVILQTRNDAIPPYSFGLIQRPKSYVAESFKKIGEL